MPMFKRKPAAPLPDPTRTTWTVEMTGRCRIGHQVSVTTQLSVVNGAMGGYRASGTCACGSDVELTGWVG